MTRVLVIGATGFVGFALSTALRRAGHVVYGLSRSSSKAKFLSQSEIIPIIGDTSDPSTWTHIIDDVDVVIDASDSRNTVVENILSPLKNSNRCKKQIGGEKLHGGKLGFIYISGGWVYGSSSDRVSAVDVVGPGARVSPAEMVVWRVDVEKAILESRDLLNVVILRPSLLFGGNASLMAMWWGPIVGAATKNHGFGEVVSVPGDPNLWISLVHKDDLAHAMVSTVEKIEILSSLSHPILDVVSCEEQLGSIANTAIKYTGFKGQLKYREPENVFEKAMVTEAVIDARRTKTLLGWEPKQWSLTHYGDIYFNAFAASMEAK